MNPPQRRLRARRSTLWVVLAFTATDSPAQPNEAKTPRLILVQTSGARAGSTVSATPQSKVSITIEGDYRVIRANGLPDHITGEFPNRGNPNRIRPQNYTFRVP